MICKCRKLQRDTTNTFDVLYIFAMLSFYFLFLLQTFKFLVLPFLTSVSEICVALLTIEGKYIIIMTKLRIVLCVLPSFMFP